MEELPTPQVEELLAPAHSSPESVSQHLVEVATKIKEALCSHSLSKRTEKSDVLLEDKNK